MLLYLCPRCNLNLLLCLKYGHNIVVCNVIRNKFVHCENHTIIFIISIKKKKNKQTLGKSPNLWNNLSGYCDISGKRFWKQEETFARKIFLHFQQLLFTFSHFFVQNQSFYSNNSKKCLHESFAKIEICNYFSPTNLTMT